MSYRYNTIAITLHWVIAACILINLGFGWWMGDALNDEATKTSPPMSFNGTSRSAC